MNIVSFIARRPNLVLRKTIVAGVKIYVEDNEIKVNNIVSIDDITCVVLQEPRKVYDLYCYVLSTVKEQQIDRFNYVYPGDKMIKLDIELNEEEKEFIENNKEYILYNCSYF